MTLPIAPSLYGKLVESIDTFSFRNSGQIKIPKGKREIAYSHSLDVIIESIDFNLYENGKANPSIQFYGYATLVFQDCLSLEIPLRFPRQRIHFDRNWEALRQWNETAVFWEHWQFHRWNEIQLLKLEGAFNLPGVVDFIPQFGESRFQELPLREVYIKVQNNCQFTIEYSQLEPVPYDDPFQNTRTGKSNQTDGIKDKGLPKDGIQPKRNNPNNPFSGNPPITPPSVESGYFLNPSKLTDVIGVDPLTLVVATPTTEGWYLGVTWTFAQNNAPRTVTLFRGAPQGSVVETRIFAAGTVVVQGQTLENLEVRIERPDGTFLSLSNAFTFLPVTAVEGFGLLPADIL